MKAKFFLPFVALAACTEVPVAVAPPEETAPTVAISPPPVPPANATTVDQFDTTTAADRAAAIAPVAVSDVSLGVTVASLGSPAEPGIWLKTPLVTAVSAGRVIYQGKSVNVELRPSGGAAGSGSQISLAAMRLIEAPLTSLAELTVFRN